MRLYTGLVDDIQSVAGGIFQIAGHGRIVAGAHTVETKLLQDGHILLDQFVSHGMTIIGILHVRALRIHFQRLAVEVEHVVAHLSLLEPHVLTGILGCTLRQTLAGSGIHEIHLEVIQIRCLCRPF